MQAAPKVSVILLVANRRTRSARALGSVLAQEGIEQAEVLLVDAGSPEVEPLPGAEHARVSVLRFASAASFGQMRAEAVRQARGEIVAFLEDHVEARRGWLAGIIEAFHGPWAVVGPEVHNANPEVGLSEIIGMINYGHWSPPLTEGEAEILAGNNTAYRRQALLRYSEKLPKLLMSDTVLQWRMKADGDRLYATPAVSLLHLNPTSLANSVKAEFLYHWCFGAVRAEAFDWPIWRRLAYLAASPAIGLRRLVRLVQMYRRRKPGRLPSPWKTFIPMWTVLTAAIAGQAAGILFGLDGGKMRFTQFELDSPRPAAVESG